MRSTFWDDLEHSVKVHFNGCKCQNKKLLQLHMKCKFYKWMKNFQLKDFSYYSYFIKNEFYKTYSKYYAPCYALTNYNIFNNVFKGIWTYPNLTKIDCLFLWQNFFLGWTILNIWSKQTWKKISTWTVLLFSSVKKKPNYVTSLILTINVSSYLNYIL